LSRRKRNFGGKEAIDFPKAINAVFGATGWLAQGLEAFSDINFHLLGYTALGMFLCLNLACLQNQKLHCTDYCFKNTVQVGSAFKYAEGVTFWGHLVRLKDCHLPAIQ